MESELVKEIIQIHYSSKKYEQLIENAWMDNCDKSYKFLSSLEWEL